MRNVAGQMRSFAIDQANQDIYIAIATTNPNLGWPGRIDRLNGDLSPDGTFTNGAGGFYGGVAVNPTTHAFYAAQAKIDLSSGSFGIPQMDLFTSSGTLTGSFPIPDAGGLPPLASDSAGRIFFPNTAGHSVLVFDSTGAQQLEITCAACPGGPFGTPISLAIDSADNLYVADASPDRVVKLTPSGGTYSFASTLQSSRSAVAVGVDPASGDVLVGNLSEGRHYHITAYNSAGAQFDDFGVGLFADPPQEPPGAAIYLAYQMAVNATTHKLYVGESEKFYIFEKTAIATPTGTIKPASEVGQITATLNATLSTSHHTALSCNFEYTDTADAGFTHATSLPCLENANAGNSSLAIKLSNLPPATGYRYRLTTSTYGGSFTSGSETFQTLPLTPSSVTTEAPQGVTQTAATLKGTVNPHGGSPSDCHFEFGTSLSYGTNRPCASLPGPVSSNVTVNRNTPGLVAGTTYHYRLMFTTNAGTTVGNDVEFKTVAPLVEPKPQEPSSPDQPTAPVVTTPGPITPPTTTGPRPLHCKKGFRKARVRGKVRCVKKRPARRRKHKHRDQR